MTEPVDFVTVLTTKANVLATKEISVGPDGRPQIKSYDRAKWFSIAECGVSSIADLAGLLSRIEHARHCFIVRGRPKEGVDYRRAQRRLHERRNADGTVTPATFEAAARHWIALDCDRLDCPDRLDPVDEPDQTVEHVVAQLPKEFHGATVWWQFTSSQGIKPGISLRLFFWSDRPLADWELKAWLADSPVDRAIFAPAQAIYTARPLFIGMRDPVPFRSGGWQGDRDAITPPTIEKQKARSTAEEQPFTGTGGSGYEFHRSRLGDGAGLGGFHGPVKAAIGAWLHTHGASVDTAWLRADLERAVRAAPRDPAKHDDAYVEFRVHDLDTLIEAIRDLQAEKEAEATRVEPTYPPPLGSVIEARAALAAAMDRFATAALAWHEPMAA